MLAFALGCSSGGEAPRDGGPDTDTGAAGTDAPAPCEGKCIAPQVCSALKRCTTSACADVEADYTSLLGCTFYAHEPGNVTSDVERPMSLLITNPGSDTATVTLEIPVRSDAGLQWLVLTGMTIPRASSGRFSLTGRSTQDAGWLQGAGIRVNSNRPVGATLIASDDHTQGEVSSSGGTVLYPMQALGTHYRVMTYAQQETLAVGATDGSLSGAGRITLVATAPDTQVTLALSKDAKAVTINLDTPIGAPIVLDDGDVLQILSNAEGSDLSGTEIRSNKRIAVFSGNVSTTYGLTASGINSPDMTHEQMPPIRAWSLSWVAPELPPQADTCDSVLGMTGASMWRIIAAEDLTHVSFAAPTGVGGLPSNINMVAGEVRPLVVWGGSFHVVADKPILVTQGIDCEPTLALAVPTVFPVRDLRFAVLPNFDQVGAVVHLKGDPPVLYDGEAIDPGAFRPAGDGYEVALLHLLRCLESQVACTHRLQGKFGLTLRGMDVLGSWALTFPTWSSPCADPLDIACGPG